MYRPKDLEALLASARRFNEIAQGGATIREMFASLQADQRTITQALEATSSYPQFLSIKAELELPKRAMEALREFHLASINSAQQILLQHRKTIELMTEALSRISSSYTEILGKASRHEGVQLKSVVEDATSLEIPDPGIRDADALLIAEAATDVAAALGDEIAGVKDSVQELSEAIHKLVDEGRGSAVGALPLLVAIVTLLSNRESIAERLVKDVIWLLHVLYVLAAYLISLPR